MWRVFSRAVIVFPSNILGKGWLPNLGIISRSPRRNGGKIAIRIVGRHISTFFDSRDWIVQLVGICHVLVEHRYHGNRTHQRKK